MTDAIETTAAAARSATSEASAAPAAPIAVPASLEACRLTGGAGTGKTQRLVERVVRLLGDGAAPADVLVLCATPQAACAFRARLAAQAVAAGVTGADDVDVITPRELALRVLADPQAVAWSGRDARLLTAFEESFLLEDMKVCGLRPRRLREMLKFFYRSWTELADDDPDWLLPGEEADVHALLKANLAFVRGIIEPEAANLAVNYLREHEEERAANTRAHVLADDYQALSRASQLLANLVAGKSVTVAGNAAATVQTYDSYPYAAGLDEFIALHEAARCEQLTACHRTPAVARAAASLLADPCMADVAEAAALDAEGSASTGDAEGGAATADVLAGADPAEEFQQVARYAADAVAQGTPASSVVVTVPNATWARNVAVALRAQGLRAETLPAAQAVRGDIRDNDKCLPARVLTALVLTANDRDAAAWRAWCGYGDYLVNSAAVFSLREQAEEQDIGLVEALQAAADDAARGNALHAVGARRMVEAYNAGRAMLQQVEGLAGGELLDRLTAVVTDGQQAEAPAVVRDLCLGASDSQSAESAGPDAASMVRRAMERLLAPTLRDAEAVAVVPYDQMTGLAPDVLVVSGFVNGFIPCADYFDGSVMPLDKQEKVHAVDTRRVYALATKANRRLAVSYFTSTDLPTAGKLKLKIDRIRLVKGVRTCAIPPSDFLPHLAQ